MTFLTGSNLNSSVSYAAEDELQIAFLVIYYYIVIDIILNNIIYLKVFSSWKLPAVYVDIL